jgi:Tfp pilus assembly protein PilN
MIKLNLLPPQEKNELKLERLYRWLVFYGSATILIILLFITFLALIWSFILIQLKSYTVNLENTKTSFQGQSIENQQKLIRDFNLKLERIAQVQSGHKYYSPVLIHLATLVPSGIRIDALAIDEQGKATLTGYAQRRSQLLLLKEALEKSSFFENVNNPISNLTKQVEINFSFQFDIKSAALKQP